MRIEFKKQEIQASKFCKFCENNGADYFETEEPCGIWIIPKRYGETLFCIKLKENGNISFGKIDESCMNYLSMDSDIIYREEQDWIIKILTILKKYKP